MKIAAKPYLSGVRIQDVPVGTVFRGEDRQLYMVCSWHGNEQKYAVNIETGVLYPISNMMIGSAIEIYHNATVNFDPED